MKRMVHKINQDPNLIPQYFPELDSSPESLKMVDLSMEMGMMMRTSATLTTTCHGKNEHAYSTRSHGVIYIIISFLQRKKRDEVIL